MGTRRKQIESDEIVSRNSGKTSRTAISEEAEENELIALATALAKKRLLDGTASNQVVVHYLKLGSTKERIEREILEKQKELIIAKTESLHSAQRSEAAFAEALEAMKEYKGDKNNDDGEYPFNY